MSEVSFTCKFLSAAISYSEACFCHAGFARDSSDSRLAYDAWLRFGFFKVRCVMADGFDLMVFFVWDSYGPLTGLSLSFGG
jgi:hypothetical protein